ncbi:MAG: NrsF family protein [Sorangiineae bacterium]|nr:NrsF family protein [Polyangiaceae bacterium]MEB2323482.1 NrsF family protein [Sorangiineae bacterium]
MSGELDDRADELPWPEPIGPSRGVSEAIRAECTKDLKCSRGSSAGKRLLLSMLISGLALGLLTYLAFSHTRTDGAVRAALFGAIGWGVVQAAVLFVGLARPPGRRISRAWRLVIAGGVPVAFLAWLAWSGAGRLPFATFLHPDHVHRALDCGVHAILIGAVASVGMLLVWRGTDPLSPGLSGALAGLVGGLAGAAAVGVACPTVEVWHLWLAHGLVVISMAVLGFFVGRRWLAP